ncbi:hypothetical protein BCR32DRAFT_306960 [Anaeromyces robustus]|uniref:L domain-like protein n=1 Tax=Anaeromyces robustus TaxID=1754192 RepID=A0A1Y1VSG9_9FUNG|nr:hypothetical protein BCR32DRAFT_306960 [Anaeromyces robustus]|eukprot:ORX64241.1 hypothetical protein BCR32DRAFT_306960 [Anaeromyces robustus]
MDSDCNSLKDSVNILNSVNINDNIEANTKISENEIINNDINIYEVESNINVNLEKNSKSSKTSIIDNSDKNSKIFNISSLNDEVDKNLIISEREKEVINNGLYENINIYEEGNNINVNLEKNLKSSKTSITDDLDKNLIISEREREVINNGLFENINIYEVYEEGNNINVNLEKNLKSSKTSITDDLYKNSKILKTAVLDDDLDENLKISKTSLKDLNENSKLSITSINNSSTKDLKYIPPKDRKIHDIWGILIYTITTSLMFFLYIQSITILQLYGMPDKESFYVELFNSITDDDSGNTSEIMINEKNLSFFNQRKYYNDYEYYNYNIYNNSLNYMDISYNNNNLKYNNSLNYMDISYNNNNLKYNNSLNYMDISYNNNNLKYNNSLNYMDISYNNNLNYNYLLSSNDNILNNYMTKKENNDNEQQPKNGNNEMEQPMNDYDKEEEIKKELESENNEEINIESEEINDSKSLIIILYLISVSSTFVVACIYLCFLLLELNNNHIINFPYQFKKFQSLKTLKLHNNNIEGGLTVNVSDMRNLEYLDLTNNSMGGMLYIPKSLTTLITTKNKFDSIEVQSNNNLEYLYLNDNEITGQLTTELLFFEKLHTLDIDNNYFSSYTPIQNMKLVYISLANTIVNNIPNSIFLLSNLSDFGTCKNNFISNTKANYKECSKTDIEEINEDIINIKKKYNYDDDDDNDDDGNSEKIIKIKTKILLEYIYKLWFLLEHKLFG